MNFQANNKAAVKLFSAALYTQSAQVGGQFRTLTGKRPSLSENVNKMEKKQSESGAPIVEIMDLTKSKGTRITMDFANVTPGEPIMGSRKRQGEGVGTSFDTFEMDVNKYSFVRDAGDDLMQQRTEHSIRAIQSAALIGDMNMFYEQSNLVHAAGARGHQQGRNWVLPLQDHSTFAEKLINPVLAPTRNRHYVVNGNNLERGGERLNTISSTDALKLVHLDAIRAAIDDFDLGFQPVKYASDEAKDVAPMWVSFVPSNVYNAMLTQGDMRSFQAQALDRGNYGNMNAHPLFRGAVGMWNGILVVKLTRNVIRLLRGLNTNYVAENDKYTGVETSVQVNPSLTAGFAVERTLIFGAQALANAFARVNNNDFYFRWHEEMYNKDSAVEFTAEGMGGFAKIRFNVPEQGGSLLQPTDNGIIVIDSVAKLAA